MKTATIDPSSALHQLKIQEKGGERYIWDPVRKKFVVLTKEEWVRQMFIQILSDYFSFALMSVEKKIKVHNQTKRFDLVILNQKLEPILLAEFKRPEVVIDRKSFDQAFLYHSVLNVPYLLISNGVKHYVCQANIEKGQFDFLDALPFTKLSNGI